MKGRITRKNSPTETIDNTTVINRSLLTSDILIILLSLHYTFQLIDLIFYLPHLNPLPSTLTFDRLPAWSELPGRHECHLGQAARGLMLVSPGEAGF